jgi:hypothetical protein
VDQAIDVIGLPTPDVQFAILLVYGWILSQLVCGQSSQMPAAIWSVVGYWLFTALFLGYWEITGFRHNFLCSMVIL